MSTVMIMLLGYIMCCISLTYYFIFLRNFNVKETCNSLLSFTMPVDISLFTKCLSYCHKQHFIKMLLTNHSLIRKFQSLHLNVGNKYSTTPQLTKSFPIHLQHTHIVLPYQICTNLCCFQFQTVQADCLSHRPGMGFTRREAWSRQQESSSFLCGGANQKNLSITNWAICRFQGVSGCTAIVLNILIHTL